MQTINPPSKSDIDSIQSDYGHSILKDAVKKIEAGKLTRNPLENILAGAPKDAVDFVKKILVFNPDKRPSADELLKHEYVSKFSNPAEESSLDYIVSPPLADDIQLSVAEYRDTLYKMITRKKHEIRELHKRHKSLENQSGDTGEQKTVVQPNHSGDTGLARQNTTHFPAKQGATYGSLYQNRRAHRNEGNQRFFLYLSKTFLYSV